MFLARIDGTLTASRKDHRLAGVRFLISQRLDADGRSVGEPLVVLDRMGAGRGSTVLVSSTAPSRATGWQRRPCPARRGGDRRPGGTAAGARGPGVMRLGIVLGHVVLSRSLPALQGTSLLLVEPVTAANLAARNGQGGGRRSSWPTSCRRPRAR